MFYIKDRLADSQAYKRPYNHDRYFCMDLVTGPDRRNRLSVLAVLDGVSRANGAAASSMAEAAMRPMLAELLGICDDLEQLDTQTLQDELFRVMRNAILAADQALRCKQYPGMDYGTTVTLAIVYLDRIYVANVGDSPAYLLPISLTGEVSDPIPLFRCQNKAGEVVREGLMTMEEAVAAKLQNCLTCMVGGDMLMDEDIFTISTWIRQSCLLLLGSDGALSVISEDAIKRSAQERLCTGVRGVVEGIFEQVQQTSSTDNFTVVAYWLERT